MKLLIGKIPENKEFNPKAGGWTHLEEPKFLKIQIYGFLMFVFILVFLDGLTVGSFGLNIDKIGLGYFILLVIATVAIHEFIHAVAYGKEHRGNVVFGIIPKMFCCYAYSDLITTKKRFMFVISAPFTFLTILPIAVTLLTGVHSTILISLSVTNGYLSSGDLFTFFFMGLNIPTNAFVKSNGWKTYWRA